MLDDLKFVSQKDYKDELGAVERHYRELSERLAGVAEQWRADSPTDKNLAKQVAEYMAGKSIVVYSGPQMRELGKFWKQEIANRAHTRAFDAVLPDDLPDEFNAWRSQPVDKIFGVILLRSSLEDEPVNEAFSMMERKLSGKWPNPLTIELDGKDAQEQEQWGSFLTELSSSYLAILCGVTPERSNE